MKQKLALSCALIHAPRVLLLDEPTTGIDPVSRKELWDMLERLKHRHGITIVVSTPYMDEAVLCDRVALIQNGSFLRVDTPQAIADSYTGRLWAVKTADMHRLLDDLRGCPAVEAAFSFGETFHVTPCKGTTPQDLEAYLAAKGHSRTDIRPARATIEDCFIALMGNATSQKEGTNR